MDQQIGNYIRQSRANGASDGQIKKALLSAGWDESEISSALAAVVPPVNPQFFEQLPTNPPAANPSKLLSAQALFKASLNKLKERYVLTFKIIVPPLIVFLIIFVLLRIPGTYSQSFSFYPYDLLAQISSGNSLGGALQAPFPTVNWSIIILLALLSVIGWVFYSVSTVSLIALYGKEEPFTVREYIRFGFSNFWSYVLIMFLTGIIIVGGFILFIVPGIVFSIWFSLGIYALILEGHRGRAALLRSKHIVSGKWGSVFWRFLFFMIISQLIMLPLFILSRYSEFVGSILTQSASILFIFPLSLAYSTSLFQNLTQIKTEPFSEDKKQANKFIVIGIFGIVILFVLAGFFIFKVINTIRTSSVSYMPTLPYVSSGSTYKNDLFGYEIMFDPP